MIPKSDTSSASWQVPADHASFAGHFPGRPIVAGVILLDRLIQCVESSIQQLHVAGVGTIKFFHPVGPGANVEFSWHRGAGTTLHFETSSSGQLIASGSLHVREGA